MYCVSSLYPCIYARGSVEVCLKPQILGRGSGIFCSSETILGLVFTAYYFSFIYDFSGRVIFAFGKTGPDQSSRNLAFGLMHSKHALCVNILVGVSICSLKPDANDLHYRPSVHMHPSASNPVNRRPFTSISVNPKSLLWLEIPLMERTSGEFVVRLAVQISGSGSCPTARQERSGR